MNVVAVSPTVVQVYGRPHHNVDVPLGLPGQRVAGLGGVLDQRLAEELAQLPVLLGGVHLAPELAGLGGLVLPIAGGLRGEEVVVDVVGVLHSAPLPLLREGRVLLDRHGGQPVAEAGPKVPGHVDRCDQRREEGPDGHGREGGLDLVAGAARLRAAALHRVHGSADVAGSGRLALRQEGQEVPRGGAGHLPALPLGDGLADGLPNLGELAVLALDLPGRPGQDRLKATGVQRASARQHPQGLVPSLPLVVVQGGDHRRGLARPQPDGRVVRRQVEGTQDLVLCVVQGDEGVLVALVDAVPLVQALLVLPFRVLEVVRSPFQVLGIHPPHRLPVAESSTSNARGIASTLLSCHR
mmetsp:Transcript_73849/g.228131  ORF Transcript_73849/g.228131 Transcript_73849/m.228131 type:complete len:354 (+) Transcript_73849:332-1393(+)